MDGDRFDLLARSAADRRQIVRWWGAGGFMAAVAAAFGVRRTAAEDIPCTLQVRAAVRLGPSAGALLSSGATEPGHLDGDLQVTIAADGALANAVFEIADGSRLPVSGSAVGHQIGLRIELDAERSLVLQGVGGHPVATCEGRFDGSLVGPGDGDLGDWHALAISAPAALVSETTPAGSEALPSPTATQNPACVPRTKEQECVGDSCGTRSDDCGGTIDCGDNCAASGRVCAFGLCCRPLSAAEYCLGRCGPIAGLCGDILECGGCGEGQMCVAEQCCGAPGAGCMVGSECCSGSCSMLNGCA